jgi:hypothetical protein
VAQVNCNSDKHSSISTRSHCAVTECLPVCLVSAFFNKLWGLEGCSLFLPSAYESLSRFDFGGLTVLVASSGH